MKLLLCLACCAAAQAATCESLKTLALANVTIASADAVASGSFTPQGGPAVNVASAICRVTGTIRPSSDSDIRFEVWMPAANWNGKLEGVGNGGFAGSIDYRSLARLAAGGYAASATDTGHAAGVTDARWALHHPEKVIDFGYRAIHETAVEARAIATAFYGNAPRRAYFSSCSDGGREALMEAQRYPGDYDGILAGAPANYWTHLLVAGAWEARALAEPGAWIPPSKLPAIEAAALAACKTSGGEKDGIIEDPSRCDFDPSTLSCKRDDSGSCLTAPQLAALRKILSGPKDAKGRSIFPGKEPGGTLGANAWQDWITGEEPGRSLGRAFSMNFFANMVFENPQWDVSGLDIDRDPGVTDAKLAKALNATDPDLSGFRQRGGKLILYHGWSDAAIAPQNTIDYYNAVVKKMGASATGDFLRLYMIPGMRCGGGSGPANPLNDMTGALERWVEHGTAPHQLNASKLEPYR